MTSQPHLLSSFVVGLVALLGAPAVGGLLGGIDRKLTARLQGRVGPPLLQPFYDVFKLLSKEPLVAHRPQLVLIWSHLAVAMAAVVMFALGGDLLTIALVLGFGSVCLILAGFSVKSPYSYFGSQRELMQLLAFEPILLLAVVAQASRTGSFMATSAFQLDRPLLQSLPLVLLAMLVALPIKMRKSPFDTATSHHAHQELVKGVTTELSGRTLALVEIAHWYEIMATLAFIALFWARPIWIGVALALASYLLAIVVDNSTARLTWRSMLRICWSVGVVAVVVNLASVHLFAP